MTSAPNLSSRAERLEAVRRRGRRGPESRQGVDGLGLNLPASRKVVERQGAEKDGRSGLVGGGGSSSGGMDSPPEPSNPGGGSKNN